MRNAWIVAIALGLLGACQGGEDKKEPAASGEAKPTDSKEHEAAAREAAAREAAATDRAAERATTRGVDDQRDLEMIDAQMAEQQRRIDEATAAMEAAGSDAERAARKQDIEDLNRRLVLLREKQNQIKARATQP
jgi:hypothetical protein